MSRRPSAILCVTTSLLLLLCAFHLSARESVGAGLFVAFISFALLLAAMRSLKKRGRG